MFDSFLAVFTWEIIEELFESLIAYCISSAMAIFLAKTISTLAVVGLTQLTKKGLQCALYPLVKKITYRKGNDKMEKIKNFVKTIFANKCGIITVITAIITTLSGTGVIDVDKVLPLNITTEEAIVEQVQEEDLVATEIIYEEDGETIKYNIGDIITPAGTILVEGKDAVVENITPTIYYIGLGLILLVFGIFPETREAYEKRKKEQKAEAEQRKIEKIALCEIKTEKAKANQTQAEQEKAFAKAEAERIANEKKAEEERIKRAKIEEAKARLLAEQNK